jgi:hypothetical protein
MYEVCVGCARVLIILISQVIKARLVAEEYNIMAHLRKLPALLSVFDALMMSQKLRNVLICALQNLE